MRRTRAVRPRRSRIKFLCEGAFALTALDAIIVVGTAQAQQPIKVLVGYSGQIEIREQQESYLRIFGTNSPVYIRALESDLSTRPKIEQAAKRHTYLVKVQKGDRDNATLTFKHPNSYQFANVARRSDIIAHIVVWTVLADILEKRLPVQIKNNGVVRVLFCRVTEKLHIDKINVRNTRLVSGAQNCKTKSSTVI